VHFDLLIEGGNVVDPGGGYCGQFDVAIEGGRKRPVIFGHDNK
jgi:hypothetical protein